MSQVTGRPISKAARSGSPSTSSLPRWIPPQLCQRVETAPSGPQWLHEIKLDGFRMSGCIERGRVQLLTWTGLDWSDKYPSVVEALAKVGAKTAYLDGELCGMCDDGLPNFSQTQAASDGSRGVRLVYFAFDLLHLDGSDTARLPLIERKALLEPLVAAIPNLQFNGHEAGDGELISAKCAAAMRDPVRIAARSFARALGQGAARRGDHLSNLDGGKPLAAHGLRRAARRQAGRPGAARVT
jgi:ATP-dependent DNA ligase